VIDKILWWKPHKGSLVPNCADVGGSGSIAIAAAMYRRAGIDRVSDSGADPGGDLERLVEAHLQHRLLQDDPYMPAREWIVGRRRVVSTFEQYGHLAQLEALIESDASGNLSVEIGRDYFVTPDVTVGLCIGRTRPILHAAVSCKWTMRSDRVQNIRHEGVILTRHRRGRQPHIVTVTVEPFPTRLASLARGTGEVDLVYHLLFDELLEATREAGSTRQNRVLEELVGQGRLAPFNALVPSLLRY
jgi:hypothetical protein